MSDRVLVTGASGFIAKYCLMDLVRAGFRVRGTVRSMATAPGIQKVLSNADLPDDKLELVEADLTQDSGWPEAVKDCRYVLHVASPFPSKEPRHASELIKPAREGTQRVLQAAATAGAERVVVTSSIVAIMQSAKPDHLPRNESDWTDLTNSRLSSYARSKTLAEHAAWDVMSELEPANTMTLSVINPGLVLGPILDRDLSTSHVLLRLLGRGSYPAIPNVAFPIVDVRDVARQHILQLTHPAAANQRWLCCDETLSLRRIGEVMSKTLPDLKNKIPRLVVPSGLVRIGALFDRNLSAILPELDRANLCDNTKSVAELGMTYRSSQQAVEAAAESMRALSVI